jgi:hypothetical protein
MIKISPTSESKQNMKTKLFGISGYFVPNNQSIQGDSDTGYVSQDLNILFFGQV